MIPTQAAVNIFIPNRLLLSSFYGGGCGGFLLGYYQTLNADYSSSSSSSSSPLSSSSSLPIHSLSSAASTSIVNFNITTFLPYERVNITQLKHWYELDDDDNGNDDGTNETTKQQQNLLKLQLIGELKISTNDKDTDDTDDDDENENLIQSQRQRRRRKRKQQKRWRIDDESYQASLQRLRNRYNKFYFHLSMQNHSTPSSLLNIKYYHPNDLDTSFWIKPQRDSLQLSSLVCFGTPWCITSTCNFTSTFISTTTYPTRITLVYYESDNFLSSQLLARFNCDNNWVDFVEFIHQTLKHTVLLYNKSVNWKEQFDRKMVTYSDDESDDDEDTDDTQEKEEEDNDDEDTETSEQHHHKTYTSTMSYNKSENIESNVTLDRITTYLFNELMLILLIPLHLMQSFVYFSDSINQRSLHPNHTTLKSTSTIPSPSSIPSSSSSSSSPSSSPSPMIQLDHDDDSWLFRKSTTLSQLKFRWLQLHICWRLLREFKHRRISIALRNVISSMVLDLVLGIVAIIALHYYCSPTYWLNQALAYADTMVNDVHRLLEVLQSMPAGLKLNRPLNQALSQFFLYHIYLWKSYIDIVRPVFALLMKAIFYCGLFGFTCILSLLSDIFSLVTIHIFCFYGYGSKLYGLQISCISALWRLFRGKKWNQLRSRVDSYSYDNEQLFIGTILFTILLFLLPTVGMYYLVFLVLRIMTLAVQEGLFFFIEHISSIPLYTLLLWLFNSRTISGRVYFEVLDDEEDSDDSDDSDDGSNEDDHHHYRQRQTSPPSPQPMLLRLHTERVSLLKIFSSRYDDILQSLHAYRKKSSASKLTWNEFVHCLLTGDLLEQNLSVGLSLLLFLCYLLLLAYFAYERVMMIDDQQYQQQLQLQQQMVSSMILDGTTVSSSLSSSMSTITSGTTIIIGGGDETTTTVTGTMMKTMATYSE